MNLSADGTRRLELSDEQFQELAKSLEEFRWQIASPITCLTDASGLLVAKAGKAKDRALVLLSALAAANFSASSQMAKLLGEKVGFKAQCYEGTKYTLYFHGVGPDHLLITVFTKSAPMPVVQHFAGKLAPRLLKIISRPTSEDSFKKKEESLRKELSGKEFEAELSAKLGQVLAR